MFMLITKIPVLTSVVNGTLAISRFKKSQTVFSGKMSTKVKGFVWVCRLRLRINKFEFGGSKGRHMVRGIFVRKWKIDGKKKRVDIWTFCFPSGVSNFLETGTKTYSVELFGICLPLGRKNHNKDFPLGSGPGKINQPSGPCTSVDGGWPRYFCERHNR